MKRYLLWGVAIAAAAGCTSTTAKFSPASPTSTTSSSTSTSTSASPSATAPTNQGRPGQTAHLEYGDGSKVDVTVEAVADKTVGTGVISRPPQFGHYAVADVLIQQIAGSHDYNPLFFKVQVPDGRSFDIFTGNGTSAGYEPSLSSGTLTAGQKIRGFVTFDVPAVAGSVVQISDPLGKVLAQWTTS